MICWPPGLDAERFLAEYWQRKPLYLPAALVPWQCPLSPEELAGLACEPEVESRLVSGDGQSGWTLRHGPFEGPDFTTAAERGWTLLVQDVEKHLPQLADMLEPFAFLPPWRIDDLMASFAAPGGSVGPHVDDYDVFLVQGLGRRRWLLDSRPADIAWQEEAPLRVLRHFSPTETIETDPGDVLYLPPGVAHHGIGDEPSMTLSIGFRAPSAGELLTAAGVLLDQRAPLLRYADRDIDLSERDGGRIGAAAKDRAARLLQQALPLESRIVDEALGRVVTGNKPWLLSARSVEALDADELVDRLDRGDRLRRAPTARFAWTHSGDDVLIFADGASWRLEAAGEPLARALCETCPLGPGLLSADGVTADRALDLLTALLEQGSLEWIEDDFRG